MRLLCEHIYCETAPHESSDRGRALTAEGDVEPLVGVRRHRSMVARRGRGRSTRKAADKPPPFRVLDLPPELLARILSSVDAYDCDNASSHGDHIQRLTCVCRAFRRACATIDADTLTLMYDDDFGLHKRRRDLRREPIITHARLLDARGYFNVRVQTAARNVTEC
jgi:hypothetical protein